MVAAALASIAANGLGAFLVAFAAHDRRPEPVRVIAAKAIEVVTSEPIEEMQPKTAPRDADAEANTFACAMFRPDPRRPRGPRGCGASPRSRPSPLLIGSWTHINADTS